MQYNDYIGSGGPVELIRLCTTNVSMQKLLMNTLEGVNSVANFITAYEESQ